MMVEGKGLVAPHPVPIVLMPHELRWLEGIAEERERRRGYQSRPDAWGKGFIANPTLVGLAGEYALAQHLTEKLGFPVCINTDDAPCGDGGVDLVPVPGVRVQVKTRTRRADVLLRRETEKGYIVPLAWDVAVSVTWERELTPHMLTLDGFITRDAFRGRSEVAEGRRGSHKNLVCEDCHLEPIKRLVEAMQLRLTIRGEAK